VTYLQKSRDEHLQNDGSPKRILALDGGGLRGIVTLGFLEEIEQILRDRHGGGDGFRLSHYFDLIAGNSTGSIIAAALAQGWSTQQIVEKYMSLGKAVFEKSLLRHGLLRAKYDEGKLIDELQEVYGADTTLGSDKLQTGLLVMTKRLDTGIRGASISTPGPRESSATATIHCGRWCEPPPPPRRTSSLNPSR
jgi:patatin-like phospholipase/acyl hydrolase